MKQLVRIIILQNIILTISVYETGLAANAGTRQIYQTDSNTAGGTADRNGYPMRDKPIRRSSTCQPDNLIPASSTRRNAVMVFTYNGEYQDPQSGLIYLRSREYSPDNQHFITRDSSLSWNRYNYGEASPTMNIDPDGHMAWGLLPDTWADAAGMIGGTIIGISASSITGVAATSFTFSQAVLTGTAIGAVSGASGDIIKQLISNKEGIAWTQVGSSTIIGALGGAISGGTAYKISRAIKRRLAGGEVFNERMVAIEDEVRQRLRPILEEIPNPEPEALNNNYHYLQVRNDIRNSIFQASVNAGLPGNNRLWLATDDVFDHFAAPVLYRYDQSLSSNLLSFIE